MRRLLSIGLLVAAGCGPGGRADRPNLLLVTIDTLRRDALGCYGADGAHTPNLDRLAAGGILFAEATVPVPITLPSHASMLTGLYPAAHGARHNGLRVSPEKRTLADLLAARGYTTAAFLGSRVLGHEFGLAHGFETFDDEWPSEETEQGIQDFPERRGDAVVSSFLRWFAERDPSRPFFAWIHLYDPHAAYDPPTRYAALFGPRSYRGEVAFADEEVGRVLRALEEAGAHRKTIVAVISDHGEGLGAHGEEEHGLLLYETTIEVPWILSFPGGAEGRIVREPVGSIDLLPTLAALLGLRPDPAWAGRDALGAPGAAPPEERPRFAESLYGEISYGWAPLRAVRLGDWKLVTGARDELFDIGTDPGETTDRAPTEPEAAGRLRASLAAEGPAASAPAEEPDRLTDEEKRMLEALGYAAPSGSTGRTTSPDPRDVFEAHQDLVRARRLLRAGPSAEAEALLLRARDLDPENADVLESLARAARDAGETAREEDLLRSTVLLDPHRAMAWNNLGSLLVRARGDRTGAIDCYTRAIEADSSLVEAWVNRGNTEVELDRPDAALADFDEAIRRDPGFAWAHYGKAMALREKGDFEGVVLELRLALRADPSLGPARALLEELRRAAGGPAGGS